MPWELSNIGFSHAHNPQYTCATVQTQWPQVQMTVRESADVLSTIIFLTRIESIATIRWSLVYIYICLHSVVRQTTREWESPLCFSCWTCRCPTDKIPVTPRQLTERLFVCGKFSRTGLYQDWCHKSSRTHQQPLCKTREIIANCC